MNTQKTGPMTGVVMGPILQRWGAVLAGSITPSHPRRAWRGAERRESIVCPACGHSTMVRGKCINPLCDSHQPRGDK